MEVDLALNVSGLDNADAAVSSLENAERNNPKSDICVCSNVCLVLSLLVSGNLLISTNLLINEVESIPEPVPNELMIEAPAPDVDGAGVALVDGVDVTLVAIGNPLQKQFRYLVSGNH